MFHVSCTHQASMPPFICFIVYSPFTHGFPFSKTSLRLLHCFSLPWTCRDPGKSSTSNIHLAILGLIVIACCLGSSKARNDLIYLQLPKCHVHCLESTLLRIIASTFTIHQGSEANYKWTNLNSPHVLSVPLPPCNF